MATQVHIKSGKWIVGVGFIGIALGLILSSWIIFGIGVFVLISGTIYSLVGDVEIRWKCENCKKEFKTKKECEKHEKKCRE